MNLPAFQEGLARALLSSDLDSQDILKIPFVAATEDAQARFSIARDLAFDRLTLLLREAYPTVADILGADRFKELSIGYFGQHPPASPHPVDAVEMFPYYLETHAISGSLAFLPDVATVDLGFRKAYFTIDVKTIKTIEFTRFSPEELVQKRIRLHPACYWFSSDYAIFDIWRMHQSDQRTRVIDHYASQDLIILRPGINVEIHKIDSGFVQALDALDEGATLQFAIAAASKTDKKLRPAAAIQFLIQNNLITEIF